MLLALYAMPLLTNCAVAQSNLLDFSLVKVLASGLLSNSTESLKWGGYNAEDTCPSVSPAIRATQIEAWVNPHGHDRGLYVDAHLLRLLLRHKTLRLYSASCLPQGYPLFVTEK